MKQVSDEVRAYMSSLGKKGGKAFFKKYGKEKMKELSQKAAEARKKISTDKSLDA